MHHHSDINYGVSLVFPQISDMNIHLGPLRDLDLGGR